MRCDVNISLKPHGQEEDGQRVEIKNVLGIRFVQKAIEYEIKRHAELLEKGEKIKMETRRYDAVNDKTFSLRSKEEEIDYRFLVDPDLPNFIISPERVERVRQKMQKVPFERK